MLKFFAKLFKRPWERAPYESRSPWANDMRKHPLPPMFKKALAFHIYYATEETSEQSQSYWARWIGL